MNQNSNQVIERPSVNQVLELERALKGERLEMYQEAFDVLHNQNQADDPVIEWQLDNLPFLYRGFKRVERETKLIDTRPAGVLYAKLIQNGDKQDLGLASVNVVTTAGVNYVIDALQNSATIHNLRWHASGTGSTAEAIGDTSLQTQTGSRVSGTQAEGANANIFRSAATLAYGSSLSIREHGLFSASTSGTLFDRSVFTAIPVDTSTSIEFTYEWTLNAGG